MRRNTTHKASSARTVKQHFMSNFEAHSTLLVAALVLGAAASAHAQTDAAPPASPTATSPAQGSIPQNKVTSKDLDAIFLQADANKDGKLDRREAESLAAVSQRFEQLDANRDSFISRAEFNKVAGS